MLISFFIGQRTLEDCKLFIEDVMDRVKTKHLFTSDELSHYETTLADKFSHFEEQEKTGKVVKVEQNIVFGNPEDVFRILDESTVSKTIKTSFIERSNLTLRNHAKNLVRKTICFAEEMQGLTAQLSIAATYYNFSKTHGGLTLKGADNKKIRRTPAMAANILNRVWPLGEILAHPMK